MLTLPASNVPKPDTSTRTDASTDTSTTPAPTALSSFRVRTFCTVSRRPAGPLAPPTRRPGLRSR